jgi:hypothetical protein
MTVLSEDNCQLCGMEDLFPASLGVDGSCTWWVFLWGDLERIDLERDKGIRWMPWHQEAMKDVARCEKPWGAASRR